MTIIHYSDQLTSMPPGSGLHRQVSESCGLGQVILRSDLLSVSLGMVEELSLARNRLQVLT